MNRFIASIILTTGLCATTFAAPNATLVHKEIEGLLTRLEKSGCQFNRNGSWYTGLEAKTHLLRKLAYIEDKGTLQSTEQFIELAASKSSFTGDAYQVKCAGTSPVASQQWLGKELVAVRAGASAKP